MHSLDTVIREIVGETCLYKQFTIFPNPPLALSDLAPILVRAQGIENSQGDICITLTFFEDTGAFIQHRVLISGGKRPAYKKISAEIGKQLQAREHRKD